MKIKIWTGLLVSVFAGFTFNASAAYVGDMVFLPPQADYKVIDSANFRVVYPATLSNQAKPTAGFLELAHEILTHAYQYRPDHRVTVILSDNNDSANGITSVVGLQGMVLYVTAPDPYSSIGDYDDWLRNLVIHEYTHYISLVQTEGVFKVGRILFGNLVFPNELWPSWLAEGLAVHAETGFSLMGRGYGPYYDTMTRDAIAREVLGSKSLLGYDKINGPIPDFPFGEGYYFSGFGIVDEMARQMGEDAPARFAEHSSWRFPWFLDGTLAQLNRRFEEPQFEQLWKSWISRQTRRLQPELDWLKANGGPEPEFFTPDGDAALGARLSPDETKLAYHISSGHRSPVIEIVDVAKRTATVVEKAAAGAALSWSPDGETLVYAKMDFESPFSFFSELYSYSLTKGRVEQLTRGERAKDPDFCGKEIIFTSDRGGISSLRAFEIATRTVRVLYTPADRHHVATPRCAVRADGSRIVFFSEHGTEPLENVLSLDLDRSGARPVHRFGGASGKFGARFPDPVDGGATVYFTRVWGGYFDLAKWDSRTGRITTLGHSNGGYWFPDFGKSHTAVSYVTSTGIRAGVIDNARLANATALSATAKAPYTRPTLAAVRTDVDARKKSLEVSTTEPRDYNLFSSMLPRIWSPWLLIDKDRSQYGAAIVGWDDVDQLEYTLAAYYDTIPRRPEGAVQTAHRIGTFRFNFGLSSEVTDYLIFPNGKIFSEERKAALEFARPFPRAFSSFVPSISVERAETSIGGDFGRAKLAPDTRFGAGLTYSNSRKFAYSLSTEEGTTLMLKGRRHYATGTNAWKAFASAEQFLPAWPRHAALDLTLSGAVTPEMKFAIPGSLVKVGGRSKPEDLNPTLRGYPRGNFNVQRALAAQAEYRIPLAQIFWSPGHVPLFFKNGGFFAFYDAAKMQRNDEKSPDKLVMGTGAGLLLNNVLAYSFPIQTRIEWAHGLQRELNGEDSLAVLFSL